MTLVDFRRWLAGGPPGPIVDYHRGNLALDRWYDRELRAVADEALAESGAVVLRPLPSGRFGRLPTRPARIALTQKRTLDGKFAYRAHRFGN